MHRHPPTTMADTTDTSSPPPPRTGHAPPPSQWWRVWWSRRLYVRIWLAVVLALTVLTLLAGWLWRMERQRDWAERPGREIVIYNAAGEVVGQAPARPLRPPGQGGAVEFRVTTRDGDTLYVQLPRRPPGKTGQHDRAAWLSSPGFAGTLVFFAFAVALGIYPVVRWLTQRLERLQTGVERWGDGDLSVRLPVEGHDEVAFLATRFNAAAERVQAMLQSNKALLANASHELRSPLARIRMGLELMTTSDPARQQVQRDEIARSMAELDALIDEILLSSRLEAGDGVPLHLERIDLTGLAAEECSRTGAHLRVVAQPMVQGDAKLMRRMLRNLLENAARYGQLPGPAGAADPPARADEESDEAVGVVLEVAETLDNGVRCAQITVDDCGPGVPERFREQVFEPFFRLPGASEQAGGVGLGLSLVRSIAHRHGGWVRCQANPAGGARFVVVWPEVGPSSGR